MNTLCFAVVFLAAVHQASTECCCFPNQLHGIQTLSTKQDTNKSCTSITEKTYYVANGRCTVVPLKKMLLKCVPSSAKPMLSTYLGIGNDVNGVDMHYFKEDGIETTLTVTRKGCVPIAEHLESCEIFVCLFVVCDAVIDSNYNGLRLGIGNATQFAIPKACKKATEMSRIPEVS